MGATRSPLYRNPRYRVCGIHVEEWALWLGLFLVLVTGVETVLEVMHNWWNLFMVLEILLLLSIIPAQQLRRPFLYMPFLIFQLFWVLVLALYVVLVLLGIVLALIKHRNVLDGITDAVGYRFANFNQEKAGVEAQPVVAAGGGNATVTSTPVPSTSAAAGSEGVVHSAGLHVITLVDIGIALVYAVLIVFHYVMAWKAYCYMRDEKRAERSGGGGGGVIQVGESPNVHRLP